MVDMERINYEHAAEKTRTDYYYHVMNPCDKYLYSESSMGSMMNENGNGDIINFFSKRSWKDYQQFKEKVRNMCEKVNEEFFPISSSDSESCEFNTHMHQFIEQKEKEKVDEYNIVLLNRSIMRNIIDKYNVLTEEQYMFIVPFKEKNLWYVKSEPMYQTEQRSYVRLLPIYGKDWKNCPVCRDEDWEIYYSECRECSGLGMIRNV